MISNEQMAAMASKVGTAAGGSTTVFGSMAYFNENASAITAIAALGGFFITLIALGVNLYFKIRQDKREQLN